ncbi:ABC transporter permease, partial [Roseomonas sp. PWR1]|nr:ABC transporter permease [Neoroseomonas nitratireducens]
MIRPVTLLTLAAAAGAGLWLYQVKHSVSQLDRELRDINRRTEQARERTQVLRAEWALLNEPDRLRQVAQRHLPLEPMAPTQFVRPSEMERRLPPPRQFAGAPSLFAPPEPVGDGRATPIAIAAAAAAPAAPRGTAPAATGTAATPPAGPSPSTPCAA